VVLPAGVALAVAPVMDIGVIGLGRMGEARGSSIELAGRFEDARIMTASELD